MSADQSNFQASALRSQIAGVYGMATLDIRAVNNQLKIQLQDIGRKIKTVTGTQLTRAASTGFSVTSKSFLSIMADTSTVLEREASNLRTTTEIKRQQIWYAAQVQATKLENQARLQEMQADAAQFRGMMNLVGGIGRLF